MSGVDNEREGAGGAVRGRGVEFVPSSKPAEPLEENQEKKPKDRWFNPYRYPHSEAAKAIVEDITGQVQVYEKHFGLRQRARRKADQETFEATVSAVICDLMHHHVTGHDRGLAITRSNTVLGRRSRYRPPVYGKTLPDILDRLSAPEMAFIRQEIGGSETFGQTRTTTTYPGERLIARIQEHGITLDDLGQRSAQEVIVLKRAKEDYWDEGGYLEYEDTPRTLKYRAEMLKINHYLQEAYLEFDESVLKEGKQTDINERHLRRIFTRGRFDCGGRMFGGFWLNLSKKERLEGLSINGDSVVYLDYSQMGLRIAYGLAKAMPPVGDGYLLPGLEGHREAVKMLLSAALSAGKPLSRLPKGVPALLPKGVSLAQAMGLITASHPAIEPLFYTGIGHRIQFQESQILVEVLLKAFEQEIVALPVHDAIVVSEYDAEAAEALMRAVFEEQTGVPVEVTREEPKERFIYEYEPSSNEGGAHG